MIINLLYYFSSILLQTLLITKIVITTIDFPPSIWMNYLFVLIYLSLGRLFQSPDEMLVLILFSGLFLLSLTDALYRTLPNKINFLLLSLGLIISAQHRFVSITQSILGALYGYVLLWSVSTVYLRLRKRIGIGEGDLKLTSALGAWIGFEDIPLLLLFSSILGCCFYGVMTYENTEQ